MENPTLSPDGYRTTFDRWLRMGSRIDQRELAAMIKFAGASPDNTTRALSFETGSSGAFSVPESFAGVMDVALTHYSAVARAATIRTTATGEKMPWPTMDDLANVGARAAENSQLPSTDDPTFTAITFGAITYTSNIVLVPKQLIEDTGVDLAEYLAQAFARRIGKPLNLDCTSGDGSSKPNGVVTAVLAASATVAAASATAVAYDDLLDLEHAVDPAYRQNGTYMMADSTFKAIRSLTDGGDRPIYLPCIDGSRTLSINGYPLIINPDMDAIGASKNSILFGDFSRYIIRRVKGMSLVRFSERFADKHQVGFLTVLRADGNLLDAGTHPIYALQHPAS